MLSRNTYNVALIVNGMLEIVQVNSIDKPIGIATAVEGYRAFSDLLESDLLESALLESALIAR